MSTKADEQAFPGPKRIFDDEGDPYTVQCPGMDARTYAAIHLRVPSSGDADIDAMIRQSLRQDFARAAMQGLLSRGMEPEAGQLLPKASILIADAMVASVAAAKENGNVTD